MSTQYVLGSLDQPIYLIVSSASPDSKTPINYETHTDDAYATRFVGYSSATLALFSLEADYPAVAALNIAPLPIVNGELMKHPTLRLV